MVRRHPAVEHPHDRSLHRPRSFYLQLALDKAKAQAYVCPNVVAAGVLCLKEYNSALCVSV